MTYQAKITSPTAGGLLDLPDQFHRESEKVGIGMAGEQLAAQGHRKTERFFGRVEV